MLKMQPQANPEIQFRRDPLCFLQIRPCEKCHRSRLTGSSTVKSVPSRRTTLHTTIPLLIVDSVPGGNGPFTPRPVRRRLRNLISLDISRRNSRRKRSQSHDSERPTQSIDEDPRNNKLRTLLIMMNNRNATSTLLHSFCSLFSYSERLKQPRVNDRTRKIARGRLRAA